MRIALVNSFFPPWRGGAETYVRSLAKALVGRGHEVTVICGSDPLQPGTYQTEGFTVKRLHILSRLYGTPLLPGLPAELAKIDAELLHANFPSPYLAFNVAISAVLRRLPAVLTWHNDLPEVTPGARFLIETHDRLVLPRYLRVYGKIIATSKTYVKSSRVLSKLGEQLAIIPNGVDCERFHPTVNATKLRTILPMYGKFVLLFVGALTRWHRYKGLDVLLQGLKLATDREPGLKLIVVGDGDLRGYYQQMALQLGLQTEVTFVGEVPDDALPQYYALADVLVLPSKDMSEGFGLTLLEANASGKPVIASRVGGIPSVVQNGRNGLLVRPNDATELAEAILRLKRSLTKTREMGRNGRTFARLHDWAAVASQTEQVYLDVLSTVS